MENNTNDLKTWKKNISEISDPIAITGMSGRFPLSENIEEFSSNLYNAVDMTTSDNERYPHGWHGFPLACGKVKNLEKFDSKFFNVSDFKTDLMDPQLRKLLEVTYEAIIDSGHTLNELKGSKTGFFYGSSFQETDIAFGDDLFMIPAYKQIYEAVLSHHFDLKGPVCQFDTACASSFSALNEAFFAIHSGLCEQAIVAGYNISLSPAITLEFADLKMISPQGKSKCLDQSVNGYGRSEAVCAIFLQKASKAKRIYSYIVNCKSNTDGFKDQGINFPSYKLQYNLMKSTYNEAGIDPNTVKYVEAHTTGTAVGDPVELQAIQKAFCENRQDPLLIGCLKSNMGHSEAASGLCALIKSNLIFQNESIPPNIMFKNPNPNIEGLINGSLKPVLEITPFTHNIISLNCFGFGGSNVHIILKKFRKKLTSESFKIAQNIPRLVPVCGRNSSSVKHLQSFLYYNKSKLSKEFLHLLNIYTNNFAMPTRAFTIISKNDHSYNSDPFSFKPQKLQFFFSGLSQAKPLINKSMLNIDIFNQTINRLSSKLDQFKLNLNALLTKNTSFNSWTESIVSLTSIQIALINVFRELKVDVDKVCGHSIGELACGYFNGHLSETETIMAAHLIGSIFDQNEPMTELKLKVKSDWQVVQNFCSPNVILLNNEADECIIKGSYQSINQVMFELENHNIHSEWAFLQKEGNFFIQNHFKKILENLNITQNYSNGTKLNIEMAKTISEYFINSISSSTSLINELKKLPKDVILIEIGSSLIKPAAENQSNEINYLTTFDSNYGGQDIYTFIQFLGKLYSKGFNLYLDPLYGKIEYPVPIDTLGLHSLIKWDHSKNFKVYKFPEYFNIFYHTRHFKYTFSLSRAEDWFLASHKIDGRILFPAAGMVVVAMLAACFYHNRQILFSRLIVKNVKLLRALVMSESECTITVQYHSTNGHFVILEKNSVVATGTVLIVLNGEEHSFKDVNSMSTSSLNIEKGTLKIDDIYKELRIRGYDYGPEFQSLIEADVEGKWGKVLWKKTSTNLTKNSIIEKSDPSYQFIRDFMPFLDGICQLTLLANPFNRQLFVPTEFDYVYFDAIQFLEGIKKRTAENLDDTQPIFPVIFDSKTNFVKTEGLLAKVPKAAQIARKPQSALLEKFEFIPLIEDKAINKQTKAQLKTYNQTCLLLIKFLKEHSNDLQPDKKISIANEINKALLSFDLQNERFALLANLIKNYDSQLISTSIPSSIKHDILIGNELTLISDERFLRPLIETCMFKNYFRPSSPAFIIAEFNQTRKTLCESIQNIVENIGMGEVKINYTLYYFSPSHKNKFKNINQVDWNKSEIPKTFVSPDLVIFKPEVNSSNKFYLLKSIAERLNPSNFLLIVSREPMSNQLQNDLPVIFKEVITDSDLTGSSLDEFVKEAENNGLVLIARKYVYSKITPIFGLLFRKKSASIDIKEHAIVKVDSNNYNGWLNELKTYMDDETKLKIWLIPKNNETAGLYGLTKCLLFEENGEKIRCIFNWFGSKKAKESLENLDVNDEIFKTIAEKDLRFNIYDNEKGWGSYYHITLAENFYENDCKLKVKHAYLNILKPGHLPSLTWIQAEHDISINPNDNIIDIHYAGLNFKDIMYATGRLPIDLMLDKNDPSSFDESVIGCEFSGYDQNGNRVMGITPSKSLASSLKLNKSHFVWPVPNHWALEEAVTVPVAYATAYYALLIRGKLQKGETVLIHAGSGGVGLAAISICFSMNCEVYTTVGSKEKREFLRKQFPQFQDKHFANSRDTSFELHIMKETGGRGVDVVLNSLSDEKLQSSLQCLAPRGRFLEIGKYDLLLNRNLDLYYLDDGRTFEGIMLDTLHQLMATKSSNAKRYREAIQEYLNDGIKKGIVKPLPKKIFEKDQVEKAFRYMATGKHVGKIVIKIKNSDGSNSIPSLKRVYFSPDKSYLIVGGFGGIGLELAYWLAHKGAKNIILNSRNGPTTDYHNYSLQRLKDIHVKVIISKHDLTKLEDTQKLFESVSEKYPIDGIFNTALVLHDAVFSEQTSETIEKVCASKIKITRNLDTLTRKTCPNLKYFVVFSSLVAARGNYGQSNYGLGNSVMENICEQRKRDGLCGLGIQWGYVGDVGYVVEKMKQEVQTIRGTIAQRIYWCFNLLEKFLQSPYTLVSSCVVGENFKSYYSGKGNLIKAISHILGNKDFYKLDPEIKLSDLGMDSLMAIEIKQVLEKDYNISMTPQEIRQQKIKDLITLCENLESTKKKSIPQTGLFSLIENKIETKPTVKLNSVNSGKPIYFFPSIDGGYEVLNVIANRIDRPAIGINWTSDMISINTFEEAAAYYAQKIIPKNEKNLNIIGYSFGGLVAMYLAEYLKESNDPRKIQKLMLIDSQPKVLKAATQAIVNEKGEVDENQLLLTSMNKILKDTDQINYTQQIYNCPQEKRYEKAWNLFVENGIEKEKADQAIASVKVVIQKFKICYNLKESLNFEGNVVHIRAKENLGLGSLDPKSQNFKIGQEYFFDGNHYDVISRNAQQINELVKKHFQD